jgi:1-acyl-sn-glycerol-3-phosphate acyltransferase
VRRKIHQVWKMVVIAFLMLVLVLAGNAARLFLRGAPLRAFQNRLILRLARVTLAVLGVDLTVEGDANWRPGQTYLAVSNHLSYLDILLFASYKPMCFVSTVEVRNTPVLGQLAAAGGCVFVERRSRENIKQEIETIASALRDGHNMIFFPEGTSTNGSSVLPFKRPLFAPAQQARVPVIPAVVQLLEIDGQKVTARNRDLLCWYGDMDFAPHLFALAGLKRVKVVLKILPEIPARESATREEIVQEAQAAVTGNYQPIQGE